MKKLMDEGKVWQAKMTALVALAVTLFVTFASRWVYEKKRILRKLNGVEFPSCLFPLAPPFLLPRRAWGGYSHTIHVRPLPSFALAPKALEHE
jgi:hypothetical protein